MQVFTCPDSRTALRFHDLPGTGQPLLFIHGLGCAASCDYPQIAAHPALAIRRRILPDLLGFGFSDAPDNALDTTQHAEAIAALVSHLGLKSFDLYGHSMGGAVAIEVARLLPQQVAHLVLSEPNLDAGGGIFSRAVAEYSETDYVAHGHARIVLDAQSSGNGIWAASMRHATPQAMHRAATALITGVHPSWRDTLLQLPMSRTVIFGEHSLPDPDVDRLQSEGINTRILPGVGHSMAWEDPQALAAMLAASLED